SGDEVATFNDAAVTGSRVIHVQQPPAHQHSWEQAGDIAPPTVQPGSDNPGPDEVISVQASVSRDTDRCLSDDCPFFENLAENGVRVTAWSDGGAGGQFGY